jgi:hypothetical protein
MASSGMAEDMDSPTHYQRFMGGPIRANGQNVGGETPVSVFPPATCRSPAAASPAAGVLSSAMRSVARGHASQALVFLVIQGIWLSFQASVSSADHTCFVLERALGQNGIPAQHAWTMERKPPSTSAF